MKKLLLSLFAAMVLAVSCGGLGAAAEPGKLSGKKLVIGTMANAVGVPLEWARQAGYFKDAGLDVEILIFATGAPINEAIGADEIDVAVSGPAGVYGLATGRYTYIGDGMIGQGGEILYARPDSKFTKGEGSIPGVKGNAESIKGVYILGPLSTTAHLGAIKYVESFGLTSDDFNMVAMDHAQAYQAFVSGQGDIISSTPPFSNKLREDGYFRLADLVDFTGPIVEVIFVRNSILKERRADLVEFLDCYYRACNDLKKDEELRKKVALKWYAEEGKPYTQKDMDTEVRLKTYQSWDTLLSPKYPHGASMITLGAFFTKQGMIEKDMEPNVAKSMDSSLAQEVKDRHVKK